MRIPGLIAISLLILGMAPRPGHAQMARLTGVWEGAEPAEGKDKPAALVLAPRGAIGLGGAFYFNGDEFGKVQDAGLHGDSLTFHVGSLQFFVRLAGADQMAVRLVVRPGKEHAFTLARTSADTTLRPRAAGSATAAPPPLRDPVPDSLLASRRAPARSVSSVDPALRAGTLLLVGGGGETDDINARFRALAGGTRARIVVIPTAAVNTTDSAAIRELANRYARPFGVATVTVLHTTSRAEANSESFVAPLREATGVWILGGDAGWLVDSYLGTRVERELVSLLARGGVIGGSSAGALIWGSQALLYRAHPDAARMEIEKPEDVLVGNVHDIMLGTLDNVLIAPHFTEFQSASSIQRVLPRCPGLLAIGIDEGTAIEVHGSGFAVLGRGGVSVYDGRDPQATPLQLARGARYDLVRRARVE